MLVGGVGLLIFAAPLTVNAFGSDFRTGFHVLAFGLGLVALTNPLPLVRGMGAGSGLILVLLLALWAYHLLRAPASLDPPAALLQVLDRTALAVVITILASGMIPNRRLVVVAGLAGMGLVAAWGVAQPLGIHPFFDPALWQPTRPTRPLGTHNLMGGYMAAWLPIAALGAIEARGFARAAWGGAALLGLACFLLSESRGAWLAAGGATVLMLPWLLRGGWGRIVAVAKRDSRGLRALALAALVVVVVCAGSVMSRLLTVERSGVLVSPNPGVAVTPASELTSFERRALLAQTALDLVRARPLWGTGPGSFRLAFYAARPPAMQRLEAETGETAVHAHSDVLELAAELGLIGVVLGLAGLMAVARIAWRTLKAENARPEAKVPREAAKAPAGLGLVEIGLVAGGLALVLHGLIDFPWHEVPTALTGAVFLGLVAGHGHPTQNGEPIRPGSATDRRLMAWARGLAAGVLVAGIGAALAMGVAEAAHRRAYAVLQAGDLEKSESWLRWALRLGPDRARDWVALGEVARHRARVTELEEVRREALAVAASRFERAAQIEPQIAARWIRVADALEESRAAGVAISQGSITTAIERARMANPYAVEAYLDR